MENVNNIWFTRYGAPVARVHDANLAKGTAKHTYQDICQRCGGAGASDKWMFTGRVCFDCRGNGKGHVRTENVYTAERLAVLNAAQEKRDAARVVKAQAAAVVAAAAAEVKLAAFEAANPGLIATLDRAVTATGDSFLAAMANNLRKVGELTEKQLEATQTSVARFLAREAARAGSQHIGTIGERREFTLTVERIVQLEASNSYLPRYARFAAPTLYLCRDEQGNRVVYKGTGDFLDKGETGTVKATVSEHTEYKGEAQTMIARPKRLTARPHANHDWFAAYGECHCGDCPVPEVGA